MAEGNHTVVTEFILLGFTDNMKLQVLLFVTFLLIYLLTLVGNLGMIVLIWIDSKLHTPMYFFISSLSFLDVSYSTIIIPSTLLTFVAETKVISYTACTAQLFLFCIAVTGECYLLAVMAYDRFIAICNPLLYPVIMSKRFCVLLVCGSYFMSCMNATIQTLFIFHLSFCNSNIINHFFCDVPPILKLSCSDTYITDLVHFTCATVLVISTMLLILISYICIGVTVHKIKSAKGRRKAFSTCASHLTVVTMFYGTGSFMYLRPSSKYSVEHDKIISVFYTLAIPMLNPMIYSLRNKEVKAALKKTVARVYYSLCVPQRLKTSSRTERT
ncbi:olfactory receptor 5J3-like [Balearica regulorum gibbericeps]|uniref:olfactory receptor 5J3-like n=1 Tax=Balearica regulorum gibbericeps TaxID=100784 RepID=UPI000532360D|nr:PREDICTED: olfactory receptor 1052-like [Balearica regulorum gibbericeps]